MAVVEFCDVSFQIGATKILSEVNLSIESGETLVLLGRSGSGKTTMLKLANGMLFPSAGEVFIDGRSTRVWDPIRLKRNFGYVIQEGGLFPHFTVSRNIGVVPQLEGWSKERIAVRVDELLGSMGMPASEFGARYPRQLSGGQRQRVGVARALAADPAVLLLDEPFGALDPVTRLDLQHQFVHLQRTLGKTSIFVTHDVREALRVGTRIALLAHGEVDTIASAHEFPNAKTPESRAFLACL